MNINTLVAKYFADCRDYTTMDVFDSDNVFDVYRRIVEILHRKPEIELTVLQGLGYCFYEILDNVLTHSDKQCGTVLMCYLKETARIRILVADDGKGIHESLKENVIYGGITEEDALRKCIEDRVTDGKGMGFGLYSMARLVDSAGSLFEILSGNHELEMVAGNAEVRSSSMQWQGTLVYVELCADKEIDPDEVVDNRTDCRAQYNETFIEDDDLDNLW